MPTGPKPIVDIEKALVSESMLENIEQASWIRQMFEEGARLKRRFGEDNVFDFSLGNPSVPPPKALDAVLARLAAESTPSDHRYMPNAGIESVRAHFAARLTAAHGMRFEPQHVAMTCGAAGGLNILLKSIIDSGDEVILLRPYFPEYKFYVENHGGIVRLADTTADFLPDPEKVEAAMSPRTRAIILNTPNNPSGVCYSQEDVDALGRIVDRRNRTGGRPALLVMDEPYRRLRFTAKEHPSVFRAAKHAALVTSFSKDLGLAGERIGYLALSPAMEGIEALIAALAVAMRILGFVNAPALMQRLVAECDDMSVDVGVYRSNRDLLAGAMRRAGYRMAEPEGAFFLFSETPGGDDLAFCRRLKDEYRILCVPGTGFGTPGYMRISYAVPERVIRAAIPLFEKAFATSLETP